MLAMMPIMTRNSSLVMYNSQPQQQRSTSHMHSATAVLLCAAVHEIFLPLVSAYLRQLLRQNDAFCRQRSCGRGSCSTVLGAMNVCGHADLGTVLVPQQHRGSAALTWPRSVCWELSRGDLQLCLIHRQQHLFGRTHSAETTPSSLLQLPTGTCRTTTFFQVVEVPRHCRYYCSCSVLDAVLCTEQSSVSTSQATISRTCHINKFFVICSNCTKTVKQD